jgi:micrococcal nuclease
MFIYLQQKVTFQIFMFDKIIQILNDIILYVTNFIYTLIIERGWYAVPILLGIFLLIRFGLKMLFLYLKAINPLTGRIARVVRVSDGDTIIIGHSKKKYRREKVRLIGVDTPESVRSMYMDIMPFGKEAAEYTKKRMYVGRRILLIYDQAKRDEFGRLLAYVYTLTGEFYNATLVKKGYAFAEKYPPNVKFAQKFERLEAIAKSNQRGIWKIYKTKKELRADYKRTEHYKQFMKTKNASGLQ